MAELTRTTDEIQLELERVRARLLDDVNTFEAVVKRKLDWRRPIRARPLPFLGGALVVGLVLGLI